MPSVRESEKVVIVLVSFLTGSVAAELVSVLVFGPSSWWAAVPFIVVAVVWLVAHRGGLVDRKGLDTFPVSEIIPVVLVGAYVVVSAYGAGHLSLPIFSVAATCLTVATAGVVWQDLTQQAPGLFVFTGLVVLLVGAVASLGGAVVLHNGTTLAGVAIVLSGVAALLAGVALLRDANALFGLAVLLFGAVFLLFGAVVLQNGSTLTGLAILLPGAGAMLAGVATVRDANAVTGLATLLAVAVFLLFGAALLRDGNTLVEFVLLLGGVATVLSVMTAQQLAVATWRGGTALVGAAAAVAGVAFLVLRTALLRGEYTLIGLAVLLAGPATVLAGAATLLTGPTARDEHANPRPTERRPTVISTASHLFRRASEWRDT